MQRVIVQVPMSRDLKEKAENASIDLGFSSLQEVIRVLLTKLSKKEFNLKIEEVEEVVHLSAEAEAKYQKATEDIHAGRNVTETKGVDELLSLLHES